MFYALVAERTGKAQTTEKSVYNRIIRGHIGDLTAWRIEIYAKILKRPTKDFLRPRERPLGTAAGRAARNRPNLRSIEADLETLTLRVDELTRLVTRLARGEQPETGSGRSRR